MKKIPLTAVIADDEIACIKSLYDDLAIYPQIEVTGTFTSGREARNAIVKEPPNLLFLDVEMPDMNGLELLREINDSACSVPIIVFYSAFDKYMIDALRASAFDFLLKPYTFDELRDIIYRVEQKFREKNVTFERTLNRLLSGERKFALHTVTGLLLLKKSDILYIEYITETRYWHLTLADMSIHKLRQNTTAKDVLNVNQVLVQVNQNCILNTDFLISIENGTLRCILCPPYDRKEIFASRRYYSKIKEMLDII